MRGPGKLGELRRITAGAIAAAVCLGLFVTTWRPAAVHASGNSTAPGTITTYAGGGGGSGPATAIPQIAGNIAVQGTHLYVPDYGDFVRVIDLTTGNETTIGGNGFTANTGDGGPATSASLKRPSSVAVDAAGDVYVAAFDAVRKIAPNGVITTAAGGGTGALGDGGPATSATVTPNSVAVNSVGDLYIGDGTRVRKVDHATGIITTYAGGVTCCGPANDGTPATSNAVGADDVAVDSQDNLWIADARYDRIYKVDHTTGLIQTMAGSATGYDAGDGGPATSAVLFGPIGISFDASQNLYIAEGPGEVIRKVDHSTGIITTVAGTSVVNGSYTGGFNGDNIPALTAHLDVPGRSVVDGSGNLYIPSGQDYRVRRVDHSTQLITTIAGNGLTCGNWGDGGPATAALLCSPAALATDTAGDLFMVDGGSIREVNASTGVISTVAGAYRCCWASAGGIAVDGSGDVFVSIGQQVWKFSGGVKTLIAGNGTAGFAGDGGPATSAEINNPQGLGFDSMGDLLIADYSNYRIRKVDTTGTITTLQQTTGYPTSLAVDSKDDVFVTMQGVAPNQPSVAEYPKSGPATVNPSLLPADAVAVGPGDRVLIAVRGDPRNVTGGQTVYLLTQGNPVPVAGNGTTGFSGDGGAALAAQLNGPQAIALDPAGDIFISDEQDPHVRRVQAYVVPASPGGVTATPGDNSARLHWYAPPSTGGLPLTQYTLTPIAYQCN